jgi:hypothetical protein
LLSRIEEAKFFKLKRRYRAPRIDKDTKTLEITREGETRLVSVYGALFIEREESKDEVKRFLAVWDEICKKIPVPKKGDKKKNLQQSARQLERRNTSGKVISDRPLPRHTARPALPLN